jgi:hypothetical protein
MSNLNGDRTDNISGQVVRIDIYESIISPSIQMDILIADGIGLRTRFPIIGEEIIEFNFETQDGIKRKMKMNVVDVSNAVAEENSQMTAYVLHCVSPEVLESKKQQVDERMKENSTEIVKKLVKKLNTKKKLQNDQTVGIDDVIITGMNPLKAIDFMRRRSISNKYKSSSFCFFENRDGYSLMTLEGMFDRGKDQVGDKVFFYDNNVNHDVRTVSYRNILGYEHEYLANTPAQINNMKLTTFDIVTGNTTATIYGDQKYKSVDKNASAINSESFNAKYRSDVATQALVPIDSSLPEYQLPDKVGYTNAFIGKVIANLLHLWVYGDSSISCGDVIEVRLPQFEGTTSGVKKDRLVAGNYLIAKCRHMLIWDSGQVTYTQAFELLKGTYLSNA